MDKIKKTFALFLQLRSRILITASLDLFFLFLFGFFSNGIWKKIGEYLFAIQTYATDRSSGMLNTRGLSNTIQGNLLLSSYMDKIIILFISLMLMVFVVYSILQGLSWWFAYRFTGRKPSLPRFLIRFSLASIPIVLIFFVAGGISFLTGFKDYQSARGGTYFQVGHLFLLNVLMIAGLYLTLTIYKHLDEEGYWKKGAWEFRQILPNISAMIVLVAVLIANVIAGYLPTPLGILMGLVVVIPGLTFFRIYLVKI